MNHLQEADFERALAGLLANELPKARKDDERMAAMIERLATALATAIAVSANGDGRAADTLLNGVEAYIAAEVTSLTPTYAKIFREFER